MSRRLNEEILFQHADEAGFLWEQRERAVRGASYTLAELGRLEQRLALHLSGLELAGSRGWDICQESGLEGEPATAFCLTALALMLRDTKRLDAVLEQFMQDEKSLRGAASALAWAGWENSQPTLARLLKTTSPEPQRLGFAAVTALRGDEKARQALDVEAFLAHRDEHLRARALRAVGLLGSRIHLRWLAQAPVEQDELCRFWNSWSQALLGEARHVDSLAGMVTGSMGEIAAFLAPRLMQPARAVAWIRELASSPEATRPALRAAAALGDPALVPLLLERMNDKVHARLAGEAFSALTGADLDALDLDATAPEESGADENPDDPNVAVHPDEELPWPAPNKVEEWWVANAARFTPGRRYVLGDAVSLPALLRALELGRQRVRESAAIELVTRRELPYVFPTRDRAERQRLMLKRGSGFSNTRTR